MGAMIVFMEKSLQKGIKFERIGPGFIFEPLLDRADKAFGNAI